MKSMKEVKKAIKAKCEPVTDFVANHFSAIFYTTTTVVIGGLVLYAIGFCKGTQFGRNEWDFGCEDGEWFALMDNQGEFRTILPGSAIRELLDSHKNKPMSDDFWK